MLLSQITEVGRVWIFVRTRRLIIHTASLTNHQTSTVQPHHFKTWKEGGEGKYSTDTLSLPHGHPIGHVVSDPWWNHSRPRPRRRDGGGKLMPEIRRPFEFEYGTGCPSSLPHPHQVDTTNTKSGHQEQVKMGSLFPRQALPSLPKARWSRQPLSRTCQPQRRHL